MIDSMNCHEIGCMAPCFFPLDPYPPAPPKNWCPFGNSHDFSPCQKPIKKVVEALRSCVCNDVSTVAHAVEFPPQGWYCSARETQWLICLGLVPLLHSFDMAFHATRGWWCFSFVFFWNDGLDNRGFFVVVEIKFESNFLRCSRHFGLKTCVFAMFPIPNHEWCRFYYEWFPHWNLIGLEMGWRLDLLG